MKKMQRSAIGSKRRNVTDAIKNAYIKIDNTIEEGIVKDHRTAVCGGRMCHETFTNKLLTIIYRLWFSNDTFREV